MAQPNLLEIVPDQLFQTLPVSVIENVQKKIHYEIERKREDLRAVVGERYRELIHAADTIEEMKETSSSTLNNINDMITTCRNLHDNQLVGFKLDKKPSFPSSQLSNPLQCLAVQVKLLMEIPEKIWTCIEEEDYVKATQLFVMARHVNTGLQLQTGGRNQQPGMVSLQRVVHQQWNSIANFSQIIINVCKQKLQDVKISVEVATACLVSIYLLDSQTLEDLLNTLISVHSNRSLETTLQFEISKLLEGDIKAQIKGRVVDGVKIVLRTVELVHSCFVDGDGGEVVSKLKALYSKESQPLIELINFSDPEALKLLPPVIRNYRLSTNNEVDPLARDEISNSIVKWSDWVKQYIERQLSNLLKNITRVKVLHEIREEAFKVETPQNWSTICSSLAIPEVHIWCHYFQPLLTARVKEIIDNRWTKIYDSFKTQMLIDLTKVASESELEKEADINWFVWKDLIGDTVIETRGDVVKVMTSLMKGMYLQDRGYTPTLERLCQTIDSELQKLLDDLRHYLYPDRIGKTAKPMYPYEEDDYMFEMYADKSEVQFYLRDVSDKYVYSMIQYIKACFQESTLQTTELQRKTTAVYTARFIQSIPNLLSHLHKCYIPADRNLDNEVTKRWDATCEMLKENCFYCWGKWVEIALEKVEVLTDGLPQEFTLEANVDYLMMQWDVIKIEEKDEEGNSIESLIKVPAGPSLKLQEFLYAVSRILDEIIPHTLPQEVHNNFIEKLATITLTHYNKVIREKETDINQRCALQLLMDIRHLTLLLVPRDNKKGIDRSHEICEFLRQKVDPFDYDVFYPHIQSNLKRSVQRVQTLFGSLVLNHGQLASVIGTKLAPSSSNVSTPTLLASASTENRHWFSLLPVAAPLAKKNVEQQPLKKQQPSASPSRATRPDISEIMTNSLPINFANARSGAASFFNSMTSDWFSGS